MFTLSTPFETVSVPPVVVLEKLTLVRAGSYLRFVRSIASSAIRL